MKANETRVEKFLASNETVFTIPVYQRNYDWTKAQCEQLLHDIIAAGSNENYNAHFIGSIVYVHDDVYSASGLTELTIIDGQQRLTTLTLIYIAIYRLALLLNDNLLAERINQTYLINKFASENEKLKLKPTENNHAALSQILDPSETKKVSGFSRLIENFRYFQKEIKENNLSIIQKGLSKLIFVDIALDRQKDNPQRIFESLNSTGLELSQADLIRNYILMGLNRDDQEKIYAKYWEPIELCAKIEETNQSHVSEFIRDYLTFKNKEIPNKGAVYETFKQKYPEPNSLALKESLEELKIFASVYTKLLNPEKETDKEIKLQLFYIKKLEINVAFPFLMKVFLDFERALITKQTFIEILNLIQSYVWRRSIVVLPTNALNKIFMSLYEKIDHSDYLASLQKTLMQRGGAQRFPRDAEFITHILTKDIYNTKSKTRMYFFERVENFNNLEIVQIFDNSTITIEHIFPQNPNPEWRRYIENDEYERIQNKYLNTIGNLTLSGNNGNLGNRTFLEKRDMNENGKEQGYSFSRLWLNRDLQELDVWNEKKISERAARISERALLVWPEPNISSDTDNQASEVNIFDADDPTNRKVDYAIFFGKRINKRNVSDIYQSVFCQLVVIAPDSLIGTDLGARLGISDNKESLREPLPISDNFYIESGNNSKTKFDRIKLALSALEIEEELMIKFE